jgi:adenosylmethionine-8-amino-7-oxononanoate aminotransferase
VDLVQLDLSTPDAHDQLLNSCLSQANTLPTCIVNNASIFEEDDVLAQNIIRAAQLTKAMSSLQQHKRVRHFRQQGMIWAFDVQIDDPKLAASFSRRFFTAALKHELLLRPIGQTVYLMPPYILTEAETQFLAERLEAVFEEVVAA